jgi:flagellar basal-body rod modification protein FlgD
METSSIGVPVDNTASRRGSIQQEDFLKVLLAQLQYQDPLEPMDNTEFMAQFAQLTSLTETQQMNDKIDTLLAIQNGSQAIGLIGRSVEAATNTGSVVGEVTTVAFQGGSPVMTIQTEDGGFLTDISLGQIQIIR